MFRLTLLAALIGVAGCAGMSSEECLTADWQAIGYEDGARGATVAAASERRRKCAKKAGVTLDMASYMEGRSQGLEVYCEPSNGFSFGARGGQYNGVCARHGETAFLDAYNAGAGLYTLQRNVYAIEQQIENTEHQIDHYDNETARTEAYLIAPDTPVTERVLAVKDLKRLAADKKRAELAVIELERDRAIAIEELEAYRAELAYN